MSTVSPRRIERGALLSEASGHPEKLLDYLPEIKAKGYTAIEFFPVGHDRVILEPLCLRAAELGLSVWIITGYMKYQEDYLALHPEQKMIFGQTISPDSDQDGLSMEAWGCPFQPEFKQRYFELLRSMCAFPAVTRITVNDEAFLASGCYCDFCRQEYARDFGGEIPQRRIPVIEDWENPEWRAYLEWRMARWNQVHAEMAAVIRQSNPTIRTSFLTSPVVELWINPWRTGADISAMVRSIDGIAVDPYYTFHERNFHPCEAYLGEWCRLLRGIVPADKDAAIVPQGFSHPTFTRALNAGDGLWAALIPPACGIRHITPYAYPFQRGTPVQDAYESCFRFDPLFERVTPLAYAAVVHGGQTEIYRHPLPETVPHSYDGVYLMPVTESLRHRGIPYAYLPDRDLAVPSKLDGYAVVILPEIACLSDQQAGALAAYVEAGGNLVIMGDLGSHDETGGKKSISLLSQRFGINLQVPQEESGRISFLADHPALGFHEAFDETGVENYRGGAMRPVAALNKGVTAELPSGADVIAHWDKANGAEFSGAAVVALPGCKGRVIWMAGFPTRMTKSPEYGVTVLNETTSLFASLVRWTAGIDPELRVNDWPPSVPMRRLRPFDPRGYSTFEFYPLKGENLFMAVVVSFFSEPAEFTISLQLPAGKSLVKITELLSGTDISFADENSLATIPVSIQFETKALVYAFELKDRKS